MIQNMNHFVLTENPERQENKNQDNEEKLKIQKIFWGRKCMQNRFRIHLLHFQIYILNLVLSGANVLSVMKSFGLMHSSDNIGKNV